MAQLDEPMEVDDIDADFDDKENAFHHNSVLQKTSSVEKGYEELDATEVSIRLRYSLSPNSTLSKSFTANCVDNKPDRDIVNNSAVNENSNLTHSINSTMTRSDTTLTSPRSLSLLATDKSSSRNATVLQALDSTGTQETSTHFEDHLYPSSPSSSANTPEAVTPTQEISIPEETSPIIRGLKSVLNMFRSSQSPVFSENESKATDLAVSSPPLTMDSPRNGDTTAILNSTPLAAKKEAKTLNRISPLKESIAFKDDLEKELQWEGDSTIIFNKKNEKVPIHKLFPNVSNNMNITKNTDKNLNMSVEAMDISYNDKTMSDIHGNESLKNESHIESDSEFLDCESTFIKNESQVDESISEKSIDTAKESSLNTTKVFEDEDTSNVPDSIKLNVSYKMSQQFMSNTEQTPNLEESTACMTKITKVESSIIEIVDQCSPSVVIVSEKLGEINTESVSKNLHSYSHHDIHSQDVNKTTLLENLKEISKEATDHRIIEPLNNTFTTVTEVNNEIPNSLNRNEDNIISPFVKEKTAALNTIETKQPESVMCNNAENQATFNMISTSGVMCPVDTPFSNGDSLVNAVEENNIDTYFENGIMLTLSENNDENHKDENNLGNIKIEINIAEEGTSIVNTFLEHKSGVEPLDMSSESAMPLDAEDIKLSYLLTRESNQLLRKVLTENKCENKGVPITNQIRTSDLLPVSAEKSSINKTPHSGCEIFSERINEKQEKANENEECIQIASNNSKNELLKSTGLQFQPLDISTAHVDKNKLPLDNSYTTTATVDPMEDSFSDEKTDKSVIISKIDGLVGENNKNYIPAQNINSIVSDPFFDQDVLTTVLGIKQTDDLKSNDYSSNEFIKESINQYKEISESNVLEIFSELSHTTEFPTTSLIAPNNEEIKTTFTQEHEAFVLPENNLIDEIHKTKGSLPYVVEKDKATDTVIIPPSINSEELWSNSTQEESDVNEIEKTKDVNVNQTLPEQHELEDSSSTLCFQNKNIKDIAIKSLPEDSKMDSHNTIIVLSSEKLDNALVQSETVIEETVSNQEPFNVQVDDSQDKMESCKVEDLIESDEMYITIGTLPNALEKYKATDTEIIPLSKYSTQEESEVVNDIEKKRDVNVNQNLPEPHQSEDSSLTLIFQHKNVEDIAIKTLPEDIEMDSQNTIVVVSSEKLDNALAQSETVIEETVSNQELVDVQVEKSQYHTESCKAEEIIESDQMYITIGTLPNAVENYKATDTEIILPSNNSEELQSNSTQEESEVVNDIEKTKDVNVNQKLSEPHQPEDSSPTLIFQHKNVEDNAIKTLPEDIKIDLHNTIVVESSEKLDNALAQSETVIEENMSNQEPFNVQVEKSQDQMESCKANEVIDLGSSSPFVSLSADMEIENTFEVKLDATSSPPIISKGYNFNFDEMDDPFATKTKIKVSGPATSSPDKTYKAASNKTKEPIKRLDPNKSRRKSQPERKISTPPKQKLNSTVHDMPSSKLHKSVATTVLENKFCPDQIRVSSDKINEFVHVPQIPQDKFEQIASSPQDNFDVSKKANNCEGKVQNAPKVELTKILELEGNLLKDTYSSSSEQSVYQSTGTPSSVSKSVYNIPELNDVAANNLLVQSNTDNEIQNIINRIKYVEKSEFKHDGNDNQENVSNTTCSSKLSDEKDITVCEVHTEDEDTMEGPFLEAEVLNDEDNFLDLGDEKDDLMLFHDLPPKEIDEAGELFIDAEAFEFLMNQNMNNEVVDSGKESLFLKFDPLFAKRLTSDGVAAAFNEYQKRQSIYKKPSTSTAPLPRTSTMNDPKTVSEFDDLNVTNCKPTMIVNPAVNPVVTTQPNSATPIRSNRLSTTISSPAIAVIDRLLCMSANNSPAVQETYSREQSEANAALIQLRDLLAEKELHVQHLREEGRELKERLCILETQTRSLEAESEKRLRQVNELTERLNEKTQINKSMATVVEEYERTIASLISETEKDKKRHEEERMELIKERDEQTAHLGNMEASFNDLHSKYEKSKQIIYSYKANEDAYKKSINQFEENLSKMQKNYETLKQHATAKLNHANSELEKINRAHESGVIKLNAAIKKKDVHIHSLEESLAQKTKANEELTAICDELINKVS